ncbi:MAG: hypothetical protein H6828_03780 [Planctomycetes bacterium]|nr:hypothetical protein [Planctomycetota bacterium]
MRLAVALGLVASLQGPGPSPPVRALRESLVVEWDAPRVVYPDCEGDRERAEPRLAISGRVVRTGDTPNDAPDWRRCRAKVLLARRPGPDLDWAQRLDEATTVVWPTTAPTLGRPDAWFDAFDVASDERPNLDADGRFEALIELHEVRRAVGASVALQVGLELSTVGPPEQVRYGGWDPHPARLLLPQSVTRLVVPGPDPLRPALARINAAPVCCPWCYDPIALARAVNELHALGFDDALRELRDYLAIARDGGYARYHGPYDPRSPDLALRERVFLVAAALFEPRAADVEQLPAVVTGRVEPAPPPGFPGRHYPLVEVGGLPYFLPGWRSGRTGPDTNLDRWLAWIETHAVLRAASLVPGDAPLADLEALAGEAWWETRLPFARWQLWEGLRAQTGFDALPLPHYANHGYPSPFELGVPWARLRARFAELGLRWDAEAQAYRVTATPADGD